MASLTDMKDRISDRLALMGSGRTLLRIAGGLLLLVFLYYLLGAIWIDKIDDNPDFTPPQPAAGGSKAVDMAAALVEREVETNGWTANDAFFLPGSMLDNMPNYQLGMIYALSRFGSALNEQLARSRGTSAVDADVDKALKHFCRNGGCDEIDCVFFVRLRGNDFVGLCLIPSVNGVTPSAVVTAVPGYDRPQSRLEPAASTAIYLGSPASLAAAQIMTEIVST